MITNIARQKGTTHGFYIWIRHNQLPCSDKYVKIKLASFSVMLNLYNLILRRRVQFNTHIL